jgi:hypothetical protein
VATTRIQALQRRKPPTEQKNKQLTTMQQKLEKGLGDERPPLPTCRRTSKGDPRSPALHAGRAGRGAGLQQTLQQEFQQRLEPVLQQVATDMGLQFVFSGPDAGLVWAVPRSTSPPK